MEFQLVFPGVHRQNSAECAIKTGKHHFIAGLCSIDPQFPMHLFSLLIKQLTLILNSLRKTICNSLMSAYTALEGTFYFNKTPLDPPGYTIVINKNMDTRRN